jgi:site-specific recombinase XerD
VLTIRESKFGKTRMVPVLDSTLLALERYARTRDRLCPQTATASFFASTVGTRLIYACAGQVFRRLRDRAGIGAGADHPSRMLSRPGARCRDCSRPVSPGRSPVGGTGTAGAGRQPARAVIAGGKPMSPVAPTLQRFFTERLVSQRRASPRPIASYRDSLKLLLAFAQQRTGKTPNALDWADLDADMAIKQRALDLTTPASTPPGRYRPADPLLAFLESL